MEGNPWTIWAIIKVEYGDTKWLIVKTCMHAQAAEFWGIHFIFISATVHNESMFFFDAPYALNSVDLRISVLTPLIKMMKCDIQPSRTEQK